jgi:sulfate adenylyltransferase
MLNQKSGVELIAPYGGKLTDLVVADADRMAWKEMAASLPSIQISPRSLCDLEMLSVGAFSPLDRFMGEQDYNAVLKDMRLADGTLFPIPLTLPVADTRGIILGKEVVLRGPNYEILAIMRVDEIYGWSLEQEAAAVLGTMDSGHPLVAEMYTWGRFYISGPLTVLNMPRHYDFPDLRLTPEKARTRLKEMGHENVVIYQPRHPMHRVHESLAKKAMDEVNGSLLIQPVVGMPKYGDRDHYTRVRCYKTLVENHFDPDHALLNLIPLARRMAGPRAGLWHGIMSRNYGANFYIVGRDPYCLGDDAQGKAWYDSADVQKLYRDHEDEIGVRLMPIKEMVYMPRENIYEESAKVVHGKDKQYVKVVGTRIMEDSLSSGQALPDWFTRPEVARILHEDNPPKTKRGFCIWLTGLPCSGKSTIAEILADVLMAKGKRVTFLDGDIVRTHLAKGLGFNKEDRITNIIRVGFVAAEVIRHEGVAVCALISPIAAARDNVRAMIGEDRFIEIFVDTPIEVCVQRDVKGLYAKAKRGEMKGFTGVDDAYEPPLTPELRINAADMTPEESAAMIVDILAQKGFLEMWQGVQQKLNSNKISIRPDHYLQRGIF